MQPARGRRGGAGRLRAAPSNLQGPPCLIIYHQGASAPRGACQQRMPPLHPRIGQPPTQGYSDKQAIGALPALPSQRLPAS